MMSLEQFREEITQGHDIQIQTPTNRLIAYIKGEERSAIIPEACIVLLLEHPSNMFNTKEEAIEYYDKVMLIIVKYLAPELREVVFK